MRLAVPLLALGLLVSPAAGQTASAAPASVPAAVQTAPQACPVVKRHTYLSLPKRFEMANTTHDGHLTLEQAKAAETMRIVARNFAAIDATHKGYITEDDIRAWYKARRAASRARREAETPTKS